MLFSDHASLNTHLADKSFIEGWSFSQKDVEVFAAFSLPCPAAYPHAYRWYIHIATLSGVPSALRNTGSASGHCTATVEKEVEKKAAAGAADDDDDEEEDDGEMYFGFDDDEEEEMPTGRSLAEESNKELEDKKAASLASPTPKDPKLTESRKKSSQKLQIKEESNIREAKNTTKPVSPNCAAPTESPIGRIPVKMTTLGTKEKESQETKEKFNHRSKNTNGSAPKLTESRNTNQQRDKIVAIAEKKNREFDEAKLKFDTRNLGKGLKI